MAKVHQDCSLALRELLLVTNLPRYFPVSFPRKTEGGPKGTPSSNYSHTGLRPENSKSESGSVMSDSLWPQGLYSPWNSPGQNTGVGSISLLQGSSQPRNRIQVFCIAGGFFTSWATGEAWKKQNLLLLPWYLNRKIYTLLHSFKYCIGQKVHWVFHKIVWKHQNGFLTNPIFKPLSGKLLL